MYDWLGKICYQLNSYRKQFFFLLHVFHQSGSYTVIHRQTLSLNGTVHDFNPYRQGILVQHILSLSLCTQWYSLNPPSFLSTAVCPLPFSLTCTGIQKAILQKKGIWSCIPIRGLWDMGGKLSSPLPAYYSQLHEAKLNHYSADCTGDLTND